MTIQIIDSHGDLARFAAKMAEVGGPGSRGLGDRSVGAFVDSIGGLQGEVERSALATLPRRGGLATAVVNSRFRTGKNQKNRVVFQATNKYNIRSMDEGRVRHPVFGRLPAVIQRIPSGWFTRPTQDEGPKVRRALIRVMEQIKHEFERL